MNTACCGYIPSLKEYSLKLSVEKWKFSQCQVSVKYLGHIVSEQGVETDPTPTPTPKTLKDTLPLQNPLVTLRVEIYLLLKYRGCLVQIMLNI